MPVLNTVEHEERRRLRGWKWPDGLTRIPDLLRACRSGFTLIEFVDATGQQRYRFLRDGDVSTSRVFESTMVRQAHVHRGYFGHRMKLQMDPADLRWPPYSQIPREVFVLQLTHKASEDYA